MFVSLFWKNPGIPCAFLRCQRLCYSDWHSVKPAVGDAELWLCSVSFEHCMTLRVICCDSAASENIVRCVERPILNTNIWYWRNIKSNWSGKSIEPLSKYCWTLNFAYLQLSGCKKKRVLVQPSYTQTQNLLTVSLSDLWVNLILINKYMVPFDSKSHNSVKQKITFYL